MDERLSIPKKLGQGGSNKNKIVRNSQVNPVEIIKMRESSGERNDMGYYKKYL